MSLGPRCLRWFLLVAALGLPPGQAGAQAAAPAAATEAGRLETARKLLEAMRAADAVVLGMEQAVPAQRAASPALPEIFWTEFIARAKQRVPEFVDQLAGVYAARFTAPELEEMLRFYRSSAGRRLAGEQAGLARETQLAGQRWGARIGADVAKDLADRGVLIQ